MIPTPEKARKNTIFAALEGGIAVVLAEGLCYALTRGGERFGTYGIPLGVAVWALVFWLQTKTYRRRRKLLRRPFPAEAALILDRYVFFYKNLTPPEQERFRQLLTIFLSEIRISGIKTEVDTVTEILVGASAVIPIFGYPDWEYDLHEVLIYPSTFDEQFRLGKGSIAGLVGSSGPFNGIMVLSKPHLIQGFKNPQDRQNVGIHEFAHLVDKGDGAVDGFTPGMDPAMMGPWMGLVRKTIAAGRGRKQQTRDIRPYAFTNEKEFFATISEYYFESPAQLKRKHPELYADLKKMFRQDMRHRFRNAVQKLKNFRRGKKIGRNAKCPCGSGKKYKHCCLRTPGKGLTL